MKMVYKTYTGRVHNGQPMISKSVMLPENAHLLITVLNELLSADIVNKNVLLSDRQAHRAAFEKFFAAMGEIDDEPLDAEFDAILAQRVKITRELDLVNWK